MSKTQQASKLDRSRFVFHFMDILTSPVLTHSVAWKDCIPQRLLREITLQRLISGMKKEEMATEAETVAFIMTRTFDAPMDHDWTEIYTYLSCKVCQELWGEDHWEHVKAPRELTDWQKNDLRHLRQWIYKRRRMHLKKSGVESPVFSLANNNFQFQKEES